VADKGNTSQQVRRYCHQHGIAVTIPTCRNQAERLFKQFKLIATRYEKRGANHLAMVTLAAVIMWLQERRATTVASDLVVWRSTGL
jgi:transposase